MATPRTLLVDPHQALHYHLISRCVRGSYLCGYDVATGRNYDHRKCWLEERLLFLAQYFAVEIAGYAIMDNHFHLVAKYDPLASATWSDSEVANRWFDAFPPTQDGEVVEDVQRTQVEALLQDENKLEVARAHLGSLSMFMKALKQPIAIRANREDKCKGHFFEQRFYSGAILSEEALLATLAYVDLNPVRAKIAKSVEECVRTGVARRLLECENRPERLEQIMKPLVSGITSHDKKPHQSELLNITLSAYVTKLQEIIQFESQSWRSSWWDQVASVRRRQKAYGSRSQLSKWAQERGQQWLQATPLPV